MVSLTSADNALKSVYLGVVANQLNINANPLLSLIKRTNKDVWIMEYARDGTIDVRHYDIKNIPDFS